MTLRKEELLGLAIFLVPQAWLTGLVAVSAKTLNAKDLLASLAFLCEGMFFGVAVLMLARSRSARGRGAALALTATYITILTIQFLSYLNSYSFLPPIAFENLDNARMLMTWSTAIVAAFACLYGASTGAWLIRLPSDIRARPRAGFLLLPLVLSLLLPAGTRAFPSQAVIEAPSIPPVRSFLMTIAGRPPDPAVHAIPLDLLDINHLTATGLQERIYGTEPVRKSETRPHVIVLFAEGVSARTIGYYDDTFAGLTPHIDAFTEDEATFAFRRYYNHTAATFRGILGQLCSTYPATIPNEAWTASHTARLTCLTDLFRSAGYGSTFVDPHAADRDHLHEMLERLRFDEVLTASDFTDIGAFEAGRIAARDRDVFRAILDRTSAWTPDAPQFLSAYLFGTHAWRDAPEDGAIYDDGGNAALNTIHELDAAFGTFWEAFRNSPAYGNSIVVLTTDHARYHEANYLEALTERGVTDYQRIFADTIPLIVHDPRFDMGDDIDARHATSVDLAPTLAHYLGLPNVARAFVGTSIFERTTDAGLVNFDRHFHITAGDRLHDISAAEGLLFDRIRESVHALHARMTDR